MELLKKYRLGMLCIVVVLFTLFSTKTKAEEMPSMMDLVRESEFQVNEIDRPKGAVLIDANTGQFLWGENPDAPHNPASIMKLMTVYLVYQAIEEGKISLDTEVVANQRYVDISNIYQLSNSKIELGVAYPVRELLKMAIVPSSNVATVMLADLVEPDAVKMLEKVNQTAQELGMKNTKIVNITGAEIVAFQGLYGSEGVDTSTLDSTGSNVTTARDLATFTYFLLSKYPDILNYTKTPTVTSMPGTAYEETFDTYNYSLPTLEYSYEGVDGLKTGSSPTGGFNIDMTAKKGDLRLIAIVLGVGNWADQTGEYKRHPFANAMLNYGFNHFEYKEVLSAGEHEIDTKSIITEKPFFATVKKDAPFTIKLGNNNELLIDNGMTRIADTIPIQEVSFKEKEEKFTLNTTDKPIKTTNITSKVSTFTKSLLKNRWMLVLVNLTALILLIFLIVWYIRKRDQKRRLAARNRQKHRRRR